jgi:hypothetical protein
MSLVNELQYRRPMAIAKITREGLVSIAVLVAILWGCILAERILSRRTSLETYRVMRQIRYLKFKRHIEPASRPVPAPPPPSLGTVVG